MYFQCIQAISSKSISVPSIKRGKLYQAKCHFDKKIQNDVLCGNMNMDVSPYLLKFKFFLKNYCSTRTASIYVGLL